MIEEHTRICSDPQSSDHEPYHKSSTWRTYIWMYCSYIRYKVHSRTDYNSYGPFQGTEGRCPPCWPTHSSHCSSCFWYSSWTRDNHCCPWQWQCHSIYFCWLQSNEKEATPYSLSGTTWGSCCHSCLWPRPHRRSHSRFALWRRSKNRDAWNGIQNRSVHRAPIGLHNHIWRYRSYRIKGEWTLYLKWPEEIFVDFKNKPLPSLIRSCIRVQYSLTTRFWSPCWQWFAPSSDSQQQ